MRRTSLILAVLIGTAVLPASAQGHAIMVVGEGTITYSSRDATSQNTLTVVTGGERVRFRDPTVDGGIDPGTCDPGEVNPSGYIIEVFCPRSGINEIRIDVADREDSVTLRESQGAAPLPTVVLGGVGADTLSGGSGKDLIEGGPGDDTIDGGLGEDDIRARDGATDRVTCGDAADRVEADDADVVDGSCETVDRGTSGPGTPPPSGPDGTPPRVEGGALTFQRIGTWRMLRVLATSSEVAELAAAATVRVAGQRIAFSPARAQVRVAGGGATLRLRLSGAAWRTVRRALARRRRLTAVVTVVATDAAGNSSATRLPRIRLAL